jgi:hypothetical protein
MMPCHQERFSRYHRRSFQVRSRRFPGRASRVRVRSWPASIAYLRSWPGRSSTKPIRFDAAIHFARAPFDRGDRISSARHGYWCARCGRRHCRFRRHRRAPGRARARWRDPRHTANRGRSFRRHRPAIAAREALDDHVRDQLFREMIRAVIVGAVGDDGGKDRSRATRGRDDRMTPCSPNRASSAHRRSLGEQALRRPASRRPRPSRRAAGGTRRAGRLKGAPVAQCLLQQVKVPTILVWMNSPGPSIERSTWLSAARFMTMRLMSDRTAPAIAGRCRCRPWRTRSAGVRRLRDRGEIRRVGELVDIDHARRYDRAGA